MCIHKDRLTLNQDYPYGIGFWNVDANIAGLADTSTISEEEKERVFWKNSQTLWQGKIKW